MVRHVRVTRVKQGKLQQDLAGDDTSLLARTLAAKRVPLGLLLRLFILEYFLECEVEFAEVVLSEPVFVPTYYIEDEAVD